jgi:glyoxylase-like metal-dependent hydrolase (beta-lactamase superfamily II)
MKRLFSLLGNPQKLDGGSMYGNAPKELWKRWSKPDELNRINLQCRSLLVEEDWQDSQRRVLLETGVGLCFPPELQKRYGIEGDTHMLLDQLKSLNFDQSAIDVVVLSHLHFDHAGGLLSPYKSGMEQHLLFPYATYVVSEKQWNRAIQPHLRDRASYLPHLHKLLEASGRLYIVEDGREKVENLLGPDYSFSYSDGHTPGLMLTKVALPSSQFSFSSITFCADLIPGLPWVRAPITMGYDRYPELLINEKQQLLKEVQAASGALFFTHDEQCAGCTLQVDDKGNISAQEIFGEFRSG